MKVYHITHPDKCPRCDILITNIISLTHRVKRYECQKCGAIFSHNLKNVVNLQSDR